MDVFGLRLQERRDSLIICDQHERIGKWIESMDGGHWRAGAVCVGLEKNGEIVAGVMFDWFNGACIYVSIAAKHLTRHFLWFCCYYVFHQLNANVMLGLVAPDNQKSKKLCERTGFRLVSAIPKAHPNGDQLIYAMYKDDCKWLRNKHEQVKSTAAA